MTATIATIWRHPIKSHGREALTSVRLEPGATLPWDRAWAVLREGGEDGGGTWLPCGNFTRGASAPQLMAISASLDEATGMITLRHPDRPLLRFDPDGDSTAFLDWVRPLVPEGRAAPAAVVRATDRGMTDTPFASISIGNLASLRALSQRVGVPLAPERFRANLWVDGFAPWEEFDLIGRTLRIGDVELTVEERITRCRATEANPETGHRDAATLKSLNEGWGHTDFGIYATVARGGTLTQGTGVNIR